MHEKSKNQYDDMPIYEKLFPDMYDRNSNLVNRSANCLRRICAYSDTEITIEDLKNMTDEEFLKVRNLGKASLALIRERLEQYNEEVN